MLQFGRFALLACLPALGACATAPAEPPDRTLACQKERAAEVPIRFVDGAILATASVNRQPVLLQVDTGTTTSMADDEAAARFRLPSDPHRRTTLHGLSGETQTQNALVEDLQVGGEEWQSVSLSTGHLAARFHEALPVLGLLGADRLSAFDVELDVPQGRMTLWSVSNCAGDFVGWQGLHYAVALTRHSPNRMIITVRVNDQDLHALVGWGARQSMITRDAIERLGVSPAMLAADRSEESWGIDGLHRPTRLHRFEEIRIGAETIHNATFAVADVHLNEADMLLGADFVRNRHVFLSYSARQLFIAPPPGTPVKKGQAN